VAKCVDKECSLRQLHKVLLSSLQLRLTSSFNRIPYYLTAFSNFNRTFSHYFSVSSQGAIMTRPNFTGIQIIDPGTEPLSAESETLTPHSLEALMLTRSSYSVVFVHGLQGDPVETWSYKPLSPMRSSPPNPNPFRGLTRRLLRKPRDSRDSTETENNTPNRSTTFWPNDFLAGDLPNVRLLTFGYSSDVLSTFRAVSKNNITQHAQNLVGDVLGERQVCKYTSVSGFC
jgi:hypothetical protein